MQEFMEDGGVPNYGTHFEKKEIGEIEVAQSFVEKARGLLGKTFIEAGYKITLPSEGSFETGEEFVNHGIYPTGTIYDRLNKNEVLPVINKKGEDWLIIHRGRSIKEKPRTEDRIKNLQARGFKFLPDVFARFDTRNSEHQEAA